MRSSMLNKPAVSLYLDTRRELSSGESPLTIRVTFTKLIGTKKVWDQRYFPTGFYFTKEDYQKINASKRNDAHLQIQKKIRKIENKAIEIIDSNHYLTPELFRVLFTGEYTIAGSLSQLFREKISALEQTGQHTSASLYDSALKSFDQFSPGANLHVIDEAWLKRYEYWMVTEGWRKKTDGSRGNSITTVGLYLRNLRHIFNTAIARRIVSRDHYPFGAGKYKIPQSNNFKKALSKKDKTKFVKY